MSSQPVVRLRSVSFPAATTHQHAQVANDLSRYFVNIHRKTLVLNRTLMMHDPCLHVHHSSESDESHAQPICLSKADAYSSQEDFRKLRGDVLVLLQGEGQTPL